MQSLRVHMSEHGDMELPGAPEQWAEAYEGLPRTLHEFAYVLQVGGLRSTRCCGADQTFFGRPRERDEC